MDGKTHLKFKRNSVFSVNIPKSFKIGPYFYRPKIGPTKVIALNFVQIMFY